MADIATVLTDADIEFGRKLWDQLTTQNSSFPVQGMFWLLEGEWHLVIATTAVDEVGPRGAYEKLEKMIPFDPTTASQHLRIDLVSPGNPLYKAFRSLWQHTPPDRIEGRRLDSSQVGGMYIEAAHFYGVR